MVNLTKSANSRARSLIRRETVMDFYRSACTSYAEKRYPTFETNMQTLNASVEINGYAPVTFEELIKNNKIYL